MIAADSTSDQLEVRPADGPASDAVIGFARAAAQEEAADQEWVGPFAGADADDEVATTVRFIARNPGYHGWTWSVTVAALAGDAPTISEVVLLPGPEALLGPAWVPWQERVRPGDLGVGDLLLTPADDDRLVPAYLQSDDPAIEEVQHELGIGRVRVLSRLGRSEAAQRWHDGEFGPTDPMAVQAPGTCLTCAFYLPLGGSLGAVAGVCANEFAPADGRAVDAGYGCGAHSETVVLVVAATAPAVLDEVTLDVHPRPEVGAAPAGEESGPMTAEPAGEQSGPMTAEPASEQSGPMTAEPASEQSGPMTAAPASEQSAARTVEPAGEESPGPDGEAPPITDASAEVGIDPVAD